LSVFFLNNCFSEAIMNRWLCLAATAVLATTAYAELPVLAQSGTGNSVGGTRNSEGATVPNTGGTTPNTGSAPGTAVNPNEATPGTVTPHEQTPNTLSANPNDCGVNSKMSNGTPCPSSHQAPAEKMSH
jgi:hypothetical protein